MNNIVSAQVNAIMR